MKQLCCLNHLFFFAFGLYLVKKISNVNSERNQKGIKTHKNSTRLSVSQLYNQNPNSAVTYNVHSNAPAPWSPKACDVSAWWKTLAMFLQSRLVESNMFLFAIFTVDPYYSTENSLCISRTCQCEFSIVFSLGLMTVFEPTPMGVGPKDRTTEERIRAMEIFTSTV